MNDRKMISLIAPFYNEEAGVNRFFDRVNSSLAALRERYDFEVVCINDGSRDCTLEMLKKKLKSGIAISVLLIFLVTLERRLQ